MKQKKSLIKKNGKPVSQGHHLFDRAIESSTCAITIADATKPNLPLIYVNDAFERITGYSREDALGKNCRFLQGDDRDQASIKRIRQSIQAARPCTVVIRNYRKDGSLFWNELRLAPVFDEKKKLTNYIGIQTDITDRVLVEKELRRHKNQLEDLVAERTKSLEEKNIALKEVLSQVQVEKKAIQDQIVSNVDRLILPILQKLREKCSCQAEKLVDLIGKNLKEMTSSFGVQVTRKLYRLTPREIEICNMIRNGLSTKDIASTLNVSIATIENQRNSIRKKLGISKESVNLVSFLQSLE